MYVEKKLHAFSKAKYYKDYNNVILQNNIRSTPSVPNKNFVEILEQLNDANKTHMYPHFHLFSRKISSPGFGSYYLQAPVISFHHIKS